MLCDGGSSLVFFSSSSVVQLFNYQRNVFASYRCITRKCICSVVSVVQYFSVNTFFQSIIVQYSSICISVNVWGEQRWCVPLCPKMTVCELYRGEQVGASKNYWKLCHGLKYVALDCSAYFELLNIKFHEFSSFLVLVVFVTSSIQSHVVR